VGLDVGEGVGVLVSSTVGVGVAGNGVAVGGANTCTVIGCDVIAWPARAEI